MVRLVKPGGLLFFSMPNRLYPFEIHTRKWGWNWFPRLMNARTLDCTWMEVEWLARPAKLSLYWTPVMQLLRHWSNFCLKNFFFNDTATTEIYTLSLHDALPI